MRLLWFTTAAALLVTLSAVPAVAQADGSTRLSLEECIAIALENHASVLQGRNTVTAAAARKTQSASSYYPQVSMENSTSIMESGSANAGNSTSLLVTQNFYDSGLREARLRYAIAALDESIYELKRLKQDVVFSVTRDYFDLLRTRQLADVKQAQIDYLEEQLEMVEYRAELGDAARVDAVPIEAQLANARVELLEAQNAISQASIKLQNTMGLFPSDGFAVADYPASTEMQIGKLEDYVSAAFQNRPEVYSSESAIRAAESSLETAQIETRPRLEVSGTFQRRLDDDASGGGVTGGGRDQTVVMANIIWDLFDGKANRAAVEEGRAGLSTANIQALRTRQNIQAEVEQAYLDLKSAESRLDAADLSVKAAETNARVQKERYDQGLAIPLDLLNAQSELVTARSNAVQARYDYFTAVAQLDYAIGKQDWFHE